MRVRSAGHSILCIPARNSSEQSAEKKPLVDIDSSSLLLTIACVENICGVVGSTSFPIDKVTTTEYSRVARSIQALISQPCATLCAAIHKRKRRTVGFLPRPRICLPSWRSYGQ